jgi:hypothetical protein
MTATTRTPSRRASLTGLCFGGEGEGKGHLEPR